MQFRVGSDALTTYRSAIRPARSLYRGGPTPIQSHRAGDVDLRPRSRCAIPDGGSGPKASLGSNAQ